MPKKFRNLETVIAKTTSFTVNGVVHKPLITVCMNVEPFVLPTWFAYLVPVFQGFIDAFGDADIVVDVVPELIPFIPEVKKLFEEMFTARYGFVKYSAVHAETLMILNFLGFANPIAIRFFKTIKVNLTNGTSKMVPGGIFTTEEYFTNLQNLGICDYRKKYVALRPSVNYNSLSKLLGMENKSYNQLFIYNHKLRIIDTAITNVDKLHVGAEITKYCEGIPKWKASIINTPQ